MWVVCFQSTILKGQLTNQKQLQCRFLTHMSVYMYEWRSCESIPSLPDFIKPRLEDITYVVLNEALHSKSFNHFAFQPRSLAPSTPLTGRRYLKEKEPPITPVSTATQGVSRLQALLSGRKTCPSDTLQEIFWYVLSLHRVCYGQRVGLDKMSCLKWVGYSGVNSLSYQLPVGALVVVSIL